MWCMRGTFLTLLCVFVGVAQPSYYYYFSGSEWTQPLSIEMTYLAASAYCDQQTLANWTCELCNQTETGGMMVTSFVVNVTTDTFAYIGVSPHGHVIVSFRGTINTSLLDWLEDFEFKQVPYRDIKNASVHEGFYKIILGLGEAVNEGVSQALEAAGADAPIFVTGHSLGAALSVLGALDIAEKFPNNNVTLINMGCPRVGNKAFADYYNSKVPDTWRIVNDKDPIPHLPPQWLDYYHVSNEVWYNGETYHSCKGGEDPKCSDSVPFNLDFNYHNYYPTVAGLETTVYMYCDPI